MAQRRFTHHPTDCGRELAEPHPAPGSADPATAASRTGTPSWNSLSVQVAGREGTMMLKPGQRPTQATVQFADGSQEAVALSKIRLKTWMAV